MRSDGLNSTFGALADPTRRAIVARLALGEASVKELAKPFAMTPQAISKHLKVLEESGLISRSRVAQSRPCKLNAAPLKEMAEWLESYRRYWDARFDRLDEHLTAIQKRAIRKKERKT